MGILDIFTGKSSNVTTVKKASNPQMDPYSESGGVSSISHLSRVPLPPRYLKWLAFNIDILAISIQHLKNEIFINGIEIVTEYESICLNEDCEKTFEYATEECDECGHITGKPNWLERKKLEDILRRANELGQPLIDVTRELEEDIEIYDNGLMLTQFEYLLDKTTGAILGMLPKEHKSISPAYLLKKISDFGEIGCEPNGTPVRVCLAHREHITEKMECPRCGWETHPVEFVEHYGKKQNHYIVGEIMHRTKYTATKRMGYSPIYAIWMKLYSLYYLDQQQMKQFQEGRPPKGFMVMNMAQSMLDSLVSKVRDMIRKNPNTIPFLAVETQARKMAEFINVSGTSADQQILEHRDAIRRMVAARYGVMPIFTGDVETSGGLNSQGQELIVTNKAVKRGQDKINEFLAAISRMHNVKGWKFILVAAEEKDELREEQLEQMKVQTATMMTQMGFSVTRGDDGEFEYGDAPENPPSGGSSSPFGGMGDNPFGGGGKSFGGGGAMGGSNKDLFSESKPFEKADTSLKDEKKTLDEIYTTLKKMTKLGKKKGKLTNEDLKKMRTLLETHFQDTSWAALEAFIRKRYLNEIETLEKHFGRNVTALSTFGALSALLTNKENIEAMETLRLDQLLKFDDMFVKASETGEFDATLFKTQLEELTNLSEARIENIVRTTSNKISNTARLNVYREFDDETSKYKLLNPNDHRTEGACKDVMQGQKGGLPLEQLLDLMQEKSQEYFPDFTFDRSHPAMHFNTRSVIVKVK